MVGGGVLLSVLAAVGLVAAVHTTNNNSNNLEDGWASLFAVTLAGLALGGGVAFSSAGTGLWIRYSRKRLLKLLNDYLAGMPMHRGIAKNRMFRGYVQYGEWNRAINKKLKTMERNRKHEKRRAQ